MIPGKLEAAVNDIRRLPNIVHVNMCDIRYLSGVFPPDLRYPRSYVNICSHVKKFSRQSNDMAFENKEYATISSFLRTVRSC